MLTRSQHLGMMQWQRNAVNRLCKRWKTGLSVVILRSIAHRKVRTRTMESFTQRKTAFAEWRRPSPVWEHLGNTSFLENCWNALCQALAYWLIEKYAKRTAMCRVVYYVDKFYFLKFGESFAMRRAICVKLSIVLVLTFRWATELNITTDRPVFHLLHNRLTEFLCHYIIPRCCDLVSIVP